MLEGARKYLRVQGPGRGVGRPVRADRDGGGRDDASHVAIELVRRGVRHGVAEVHQGGGLRGGVDEQGVTADGAVRDAGLPEDQQLTVEVVQGGVTHLAGVSLGQRQAGQR